MFRTQIISAARPLWISGSRNFSSYKTRWAALVPFAQYDFPSYSTRSIYLATPRQATLTNVQPNFFVRMIKKIPIFNVDKYRRRVSAMMMYEDVVKSIKYSDFFADLKLPDTFASWFIITELHVWMLMTIYMDLEVIGQDMRNTLVQTMWDDINVRASKLEGANTKATKLQINELSHQFNAAIISYDEGIQSDDKVLAGAVWRRFFQCEGNDPEAIEKLVHYIRKQMNELDHLPATDVKTMRKYKWLDFRNP